MQNDPFEYLSDGPSTPATQCFAVVPDDADLEKVIKALYVGRGGDIAIIPLAQESSVIFRNVPSGGILAVRVRAILATGTTASDLVGLA
ncbi:hypothetical protein B2G71_22225 [Novosphingobium sp. PC22D]|uniref:spike base protein, RCAP_Rcc01079 family n=1 Tax=Novosphingobium sp. PC22D TaxID=1962403 RepID=UPI000BF161C5|nr:hypothetical protein [Novosphingobium sp. PC22D]PEQ10477.1 hypothetical protein B2G71_22225 [Novosphingobium sp. PC22D]